MFPDPNPKPRKPFGLPRAAIFLSIPPKRGQSHMRAAFLIFPLSLQVRNERDFATLARIGMILSVGDPNPKFPFQP